MMNVGCEIQVAARGWKHAGWQDNFYPDDLPEDWRLAYYSNEFRAVVIPAQQWLVAEIDAIESWREDTHKDFNFYLEVDDFAVDWKRFAQKAAILESQLSGILLRPRQWKADASVLAASLQQAAAIAPCCLLLPENQHLHGDEQTVLLKAHAEQGWRLTNDAGETMSDSAQPPWYGHAALAFIQVTGNSAYSPRQWREIISASQSGVDNCRRRVVLMMFGGECPDIETMRSVTTISGLLAMPAQA